MTNYFSSTQVQEYFKRYHEYNNKIQEIKQKFEDQQRKVTSALADEFWSQFKTQDEMDFKQSALDCIGTGLICCSQCGMCNGLLWEQN